MHFHFNSGHFSTHSIKVTGMRFSSHCEARWPSAAGSLTSVDRCWKTSWCVNVRVWDYAAIFTSVLRSVTTRPPPLGLWPAPFSAVFPSSTEWYSGMNKMKICSHNSVKASLTFATLSVYIVRHMMPISLGPDLDFRSRSEKLATIQYVSKKHSRNF